MTIARSVADVLVDHVVLEYERTSMSTCHTCKRWEVCWGTCGSTAARPAVCLDNGCGADDRNVRSQHRAVRGQRRRLITFEKGQRTDDVTQGYLRKSKENEGVLYVGKAQEKARIMRKSVTPL